MERKTQTVEMEGNRVFIVTRTFLKGPLVPEYLFRQDWFEVKPEVGKEIAKIYTEQ